MERWAQIQDGKYEISDHGNARHVRLDRPVAGSPNQKGYRQLKLHIGKGKYKVKLVHRLVLENFVGPPPSPDHQANHKDGNKANNHHTNLEWVTPSENIRHSYRHGLNGGLKGEANGRAKLTNEDVRAIRRSGETLVTLAGRYGVTPTLVSMIRRGKVWTHVK